jgi:hypothetical protein
LRCRERTAEQQSSFVIDSKEEDLKWDIEEEMEVSVPEPK